MVGSGSFGEVFIAKLTCNNTSEDTSHYPQLAAVKVEKDTTNTAQLTNEMTVLGEVHKKNPGLTGFPRVYASGVEVGCTFMVMDLLGPNLQDLMTLCGGKFTLPTALRIALDICRLLEILHDAGFVYRDIKPENFVMGTGRRSDTVYMVDFGLARRFRDQVTQLILPYK